MKKKIRFVSRFKKMISRNVLFYKIWFYGIRKYQGDPIRLPSVDDDFYFDGYPRSGNTFFAGLLGKVYSEKRFASHLHVISGLKIALKKELPIFVIIREPKDAVVSNLYRNVIENKRKSADQRLIEGLLTSYCNYYLFVSEHIDDINVVSFDVCTNNELLIVYHIAEVTGFEIKPDNFLKKVLKDFKLTMKEKEEQKSSQASSLPNIHRMNFKNDYLSKVLHSPSYGTAEKIYNELIESHSLIPE